MLRKLSVVAVAVALSSCSYFEKSPNLVNTQSLIDIESSYGIALSAAVGYRNYCAPQGAKVMNPDPICKRSTIVTLQDYDKKAEAAIQAARNFVKNNPNISAVTALQAASTAVADFKTALAQNGVK